MQYCAALFDTRRQIFFMTWKMHRFPRYSNLRLQYWEDTTILTTETKCLLTLSLSGLYGCLPMAFQNPINSYFYYKRYIHLIFLLILLLLFTKKYCFIYGCEVAFAFSNGCRSDTSQPRIKITIFNLEKLNFQLPFWVCSAK